MKVKFNLPSKRFNSKFSFDNNTSFGVGNVQPLFCKYVVPKCKISIDFGQLTRLSPLVVPTFARLRQQNKFVYVNINKVFPAFDAFMSQTPVYGTNKNYTPKSVPCTTNHDLFCALVSHYAWVNTSIPNVATLENNLYFKFANGNKTVTQPTSSHVVNRSDLSKIKTDFIISYNDNSVSPNVLYTSHIKLTQDGRYWYALLRGLGYSVDYDDYSPVSILPLWAFYKAYYDVFYPKRFNAWHNSNAYLNINGFYNGKFENYVYNDIEVDYFSYPSQLLMALFGQNNFMFPFFGVLDNDIFNACLPKPLINNIQPDLSIRTSDDNTLVSGPQGVPNIFTGSTVNADNFSILNKLWSYVSKSSVVGQSVKDWFKVHFGVNPSEDMFDSSVLIADKDNFININQVVSNAQTDGAQLGDLAGQAFSQSSDKVEFECPQFGYVMCLSCIIPISRISGGSQPESYNVTLFQQPLPDFDGLGYEVINNSSLYDHNYRGSYLMNDTNFKKGFGFVPRYSSFKTYNNIRSGGFALPSISDSYLSYCEDSVLDSTTFDKGKPSSEGMQVFWPWRYPGMFESYNRIFYNQHSFDNLIEQDYVDDNFLCQTAFDVSYSSYLKPLSDSYSIESLGNQVLSVKRQ